MRAQNPRPSPLDANGFKEYANERIPHMLHTLSQGIGRDRWIAKADRGR